MVDNRTKNLSWIINDASGKGNRLFRFLSGKQKIFSKYIGHSENKSYPKSKLEFELQPTAPEEVIVESGKCSSF